MEPMREIMSSSFDKETTDNKNTKYGKQQRQQRQQQQKRSLPSTEIKSPSSSSNSPSQSQPSVTEISLSDQDKEDILINSSFDDSIKNGRSGRFGLAVARSAATGVLMHYTRSPKPKKTPKDRAAAVVAAAAAAASNATDSNGDEDNVSTTSSEESWSFSKKRRREDPVGDILVKMLNEGRVPYFGRPSLLAQQQQQHQQQQLATMPMQLLTVVVVEEEEGFKLCPLFTARNYRALRRLLWEVWRGNDGRGISLLSEAERGNANSTQQRQSMWFLIESFGICFIAVYAANDVVLRLMSEAIFYAAYLVLSFVLFDLEEIKRVLSLLPLRSTAAALPSFTVRWTEKVIAVAMEIVGIFERDFLWGHRFQGRTFFWSDNVRLNKFRRKHRRLMATNFELKQKKRERKRAKAEMRRRGKRGETLTVVEVDKVEEDNDAREELEANARYFVLKPPTFFPDRVNTNGEGEGQQQQQQHGHSSSTTTTTTGDATQRHLESLQYCHKMIFTRKREQEMLKPVYIKATSNVNRCPSVKTSVCSPKEAIEVVDQFPDIGSDTNLECPRGDDSVSTSFSDNNSAEYDDQGSAYSSEQEDGDDSESVGSHESESTARSMPWVVVGAKIGHKLLTARKLRRVISNPGAARNLLPDEAQKLINSINNNNYNNNNNNNNYSSVNSDNDLPSPESLPSSSKSSSWDGPLNKSSGTFDDIVDDRGGSIALPFGGGVPRSRSYSIDRLPEMLKPPVHGMRTSAASAAKTSNSYGATLEASPPRRENNNINSINVICASSSPPRWPLQGKTPSVFATPPPPACSLEVDSLPHRGRVYGSGGHRTPSPFIYNTPASSPPQIKEMAFSGTTVTPLHMNLSRKLFSVKESGVQQDSLSTVTRLAPIEKGVKMVIPMFPPNCQTNATRISGSGFYQMGTVISSLRIYIPPNENHKIKSKRKKRTNCLSVHVILDKALLRGSKFFEFHMRIMDEWNYIPRHSKFPMGSCVATTFGVGVLVGWRVEDDMHIIRSLWNRSGPGSGLAYLRRDSVHSVVEAAVGYDVQTAYGAGKVLAYVRGGKINTKGKYIVRLKGRHRGPVMEFNRCQILSCQGATFVPVTEHIRAAALYRLEVLNYKAKLREKMLNGPSKGVRIKGMWRNFSEYIDLFANSFSKAIAEDPDFDQEVDKFVSHIITLLDEKNVDDAGKTPVESIPAEQNTGLCSPARMRDKDKNDAEATVGWNINDVFGCFFVDPLGTSKDHSDNQGVLIQAQAFEEAHDSAEILIRVLLRTITVARASVPDRPKLRMSLSAMHEALLFVRQILRVQKKHTSRKLIEAWFRALSEISTTFGPLKQRTAALGVQIAKKFRKHGNIAKRRILRFVDIILGDTQLLHALELGEWKKAFFRLETAIVQANITDAATCEQLHRGVIMMYKNLAPRKKDRKSKAAAARNGQKMVNFAKIIKVIASPGRSIIRLLTRDEVLAVFDRVLVRVFEKDPHCSMIINIYAWNFESLRHLRTLNNMSIAGKLWETVLDAIDEELTFATSEIPEQTKYFIEPFVKLFSLGVSQFHCIQRGDSTSDWLEFLMHDDAVKIIQELDYKLIDSLEALCTDIKQVVQVLPYIKTIDNDILNLMDEFNFDLFLKDITDCIGDSHKSMAYITERSAILVERFLDYLPRMSVPIERRELQDGWVLTCRSKDGGDLRLSDLSVLRENLHLSVLGSENVFHPSSGNCNYIGSSRDKSPVGVGSFPTDDVEMEESVLDEVRELILSAQSHGSWVPGVGGLKEAYHHKGVPQPLTGFPLSDGLKTQIDLWQTSAISDFELLETAIREVSYQIQLQKEREENGFEVPLQTPNITPKHFNPRMDPTVLFLDIKNLTLRLDDFGFRVEKGKPLTIFDPVFEGCGSITVSNVSITLKVEVKKERVFRSGLETPIPVLQLAKFEVGLEKLKLEFMETGADWILNAVLKGFSHKITEIVQDNLKEQIVKQVHILLEQMNSFIDSNPDLLMNALGITMADIEESIVCV